MAAEEQEKFADHRLETPAVCIGGSFAYCSAP